MVEGTNEHLQLLKNDSIYREAFVLSHLNEVNEFAYLWNYDLKKIWKEALRGDLIAIIYLTNKYKGEEQLRYWLYLGYEWRNKI